VQGGRRRRVLGNGGSLPGSARSWKPDQDDSYAAAYATFREVEEALGKR
jgi:hypothetical protein